MRVGRTLPPAAAPIFLGDIFSGLSGLLKGPAAVKQLTRELREYYQCSYCVDVSSGKAALAVILKAVSNLNPDADEVVIPAFTCYSVPAAIMKAGLNVRVCDIDPKTLDFDFGHLEQILSSDRENESGRKNRILAVLPTHMFGNPSDVDRIRSLVRRDPVIYVVEDAAQAMGGEVDGRKTGTLGDVGFFSLDRGKALSSVAGGIILTNESEIAAQIETLCDRLGQPGIAGKIKLIVYAIILWVFMRPQFFWLPRSLPFLKLGETVFDPDFEIQRLTGFQAGLLKQWQKKIKAAAKHRKQLVAFWQKYFQTSALEYLDAMQCTAKNLIRFPVRVLDDKLRQKILQKGDACGLGMAASYPDSINHIKALEKKFDFPQCPNAAVVAKQLITIPVHSFVTLKDRERIQQVLEKPTCKPMKSII